jgi:hypothetical protein
VWIPPVGPRLACAVTAEKVSIDPKTHRYTPMPFTLTDTTRNTGGVATDTVFTTILLPDGLSLAAGAGNTQIRKLQPAKLQSKAVGTSSWKLTHAVTTEAKSYLVEVCSRRSNVDSVCCTILVQIPPVEAPVLECAIAAVDSLYYNVSTDSYDPNPFPFTVSVRNTGTLDADSASATIDLPPEFALDPPNQPTRLFFNPMLVVKWTPSLPPNEVTWTVRALDQKKRTAGQIKVRLNGIMRVN